MIKSKNTILITLALTIVMLCLVLFPPITKPDAVSLFTAGEVVHPKTYSKGIIAAAGDDEGVVTDADGNVFLYNPIDGVVFSKNGIAYDKDSALVYFRPETNEFTTSTGTSLELLKNTINNSYFLSNGTYKVKSVGINDSLFGIMVKANTSFNPTTKEFDILCTRVFVKSSWWQQVIGNKGYYEYYTVTGTYLSTDEIYVSPRVYGGLYSFFKQGFTGNDPAMEAIMWDVNNFYGTLSDFLEEVHIYSDWLGREYALDPRTGNRLKDDGGNYIFISNGQLFDYANLPLIGRNAWPLYYDAINERYLTHDGYYLTANGDVLTDNYNIAAHSITEELYGDLRLYFIVLKDAVTIIPCTGKLINVGAAKMEYYDLNGKLIPESEIIVPQISLEDREVHWPEEFVDEDDRLWSRFKSFFTSLLDGSLFDGLFGFDGSILDKFVSIIKIVFFAIGAFIVLIILYYAYKFFAFLFSPFVRAVEKRKNNLNSNNQQGSG